MRTAKGAARARVSPAKRSASKTPRNLRLTVQHATLSRATPSQRQFRAWILASLRNDACITVRLVGTREGRMLNRAYRHRDRATNVLTFVMRAAPPYECDIALCVPLIKREAREQGKELAAHYAHLTIHGVLHLQGYGHDREAEARTMERLETRILKQLGYPDPYASIAHGRHPH